MLVGRPWLYTNAMLIVSKTLYQRHVSGTRDGAGPNETGFSFDALELG